MRRDNTHSSRNSPHLMRFPLALLLFSCLSLFAILFSVVNGSGSTSGVDFVQLMDKLFRGSGLSDDESFLLSILVSIRIPRVAVAALCGASLAASGVLSQGLFRNSLASPSILGTSSGAAAAASFCFVSGIAWANWLIVPATSVVGAALATFLVLGMTKGESKGLDRLLLSGLAVSAIFGAVTSLNVSLLMQRPERAAAAFQWIMGGFSGKGWEHVQWAIGPTLLGIAIAFLVAKRLDVLGSGEQVASSLGVDPQKLRFLVVLTIALLEGVAVSVGGTIAFIGLMVPHLTRRLVGPYHQRLVACSILNGMTLVVAADWLARHVIRPQEMEVGILTAILGAPFFLYLLLREKRQV